MEAKLGARAFYGKARFPPVEAAEAMRAMMDRADASQIIPDGDPFALFAAWFAEARASEPNDSNAMALATATPDGAPSVRMVLLKDHGPEGFVFYTNAHSRKGGELLANPRAALLFHWKSLRPPDPHRRAAGTKSMRATADAYFASRHRDSQLGAVASDQSAPLADRATFVERYEAAAARYRGRPGRAAAALDRVPAASRGFRILDRPPAPPARAPPLRPRGRAAGPARLLYP